MKARRFFAPKEVYTKAEAWTIMQRYADEQTRAFKKWLDEEGYGFVGNPLNTQTISNLIGLFKKSLKRKP